MSTPCERTPAGTDLIEEYLDHVCASMVGLVPRPRREASRNELRDHLLSLAEELHAEGVELSVALRRACDEMGNPREIGQALVSTWRSPRATAGGGAGVTALATFCGPTALLLMLLTEQVVSAGDAIRGLDPRLQVLGTLIPVLAGGATGWRHPHSSVRSLAPALSACLAAALLIGLTLQPATGPLELFPWLLLGWPALGTASFFLARRARSVSLRHQSGWDPAITVPAAGAAAPAITKERK